MNKVENKSEWIEGRRTKWIKDDGEIKMWIKK